MTTVEVPVELCNAVRESTKDDPVTKLRISNTSKFWDEVVHGMDCSPKVCGDCKKGSPCSRCVLFSCVVCGEVSSRSRSDGRADECRACHGDAVRAARRRECVSQVLQSMRVQPAVLDFVTILKLVQVELAHHDPYEISVALDRFDDERYRLGKTFANSLLDLPSLQRLTLVDMPIVDSFVSTLIREKNVLLYVRLVRCRKLKFAVVDEGVRVCEDNAPPVLCLEEMHVSPRRLANVFDGAVEEIVLRNCKFDVDELLNLERLKVVVE